MLEIIEAGKEAPRGGRGGIEGADDDRKK